MLNKFSNEDYNYINRLRVRSFRAHNDISFKPGSASVLILGSNGVGKTSILEAISIFSYGKGIRNAKLYDMINKDKKEFLIDCFSKGFRPRQILVEFDELTVPSRRGFERVTEINQILINNNYQLIKTDGKADFLYLKN